MVLGIDVYNEHKKIEGLQKQSQEFLFDRIDCRHFRIWIYRNLARFRYAGFYSGQFSSDNYYGGNCKYRN